MKFGNNTCEVTLYCGALGGGNISLSIMTAFLSCTVLPLRLANTSSDSKLFGDFEVVAASEVEETEGLGERTFPEAAGGFLLVLLGGLSGSLSLPRLEVLVLK